MPELSGVNLTGAAQHGEAAAAADERLQAEATLIRRAQAYDSDALSEIYETYYPRIYQYLHVQLADAHQAEDMASDVLLQVLEAIHRYKINGSPFAAWVFRIARNRVIDHHRKRRRRTHVELEDNLPSQADGPQVVAERSVEQAYVRAALHSLTEEQRQVILLKFMDEMDNASVAKVLGRSLGAVKSLQHRALVTMRKVLEQEDIRG